MAGASTFTWGPKIRLDSKASPFDSPLPQTHRAFAGVPPVSWQRLNVGGILVTVYGLEKALLESDRSQLVCCWLLHGRGDTQDSMAYCAGAFISSWRKIRKQGQPGLICVSFDQRNHGSRMIDNNSNESWKGGNPTHGPDMFNIYSGTAQDVSFLITHLPNYLPTNPKSHICCGVSLGGHATWQVIVHDPRVTAAIVVIGCPDYVRLMTDRAIRSKLKTCMDSDPPGKNFLGSRDFPKALEDAVEVWDPVGLLFSGVTSIWGDSDLAPASPPEQQRLFPVLKRHLGGKSIIHLAGGKDRLVPHAQSKPFLRWLANAVQPGSGWCQEIETRLSSVVDETAGHEFSLLMRKEAEKWLCSMLSSDDLGNGSKL